MTLISPTLTVFIPKRDGLFSPNHRLLKNEILYNLSSGSVTNQTVPNPSSYVSSLSVCTFTTEGTFPMFPLKIISLMTSKLTDFHAL